MIKKIKKIIHNLKIGREINQWIKRGSSMDDFINYKISIGKEHELMDIDLWEYYES